MNCESEIINYLTNMSMNSDNWAINDFGNSTYNGFLSIFYSEMPEALKEIFIIGEKNNFEIQEGGQGGSILYKGIINVCSKVYYISYCVFGTSILNNDTEVLFIEKTFKSSEV